MITESASAFAFWEVAAVVVGALSAYLAAWAARHTPPRRESDGQ